MKVLNFQTTNPATKRSLSGSGRIFRERNWRESVMNSSSTGLIREKVLSVF